MELYGTYLSYLIQHKLTRSEKALSVKELAVVIHIYDTRREQANLERRIRSAVKRLLSTGAVVLEPHRMGQKNIFVTKYKINGRQQTTG